MIDLSSVDVEDLLERLDLQNARLTASGTEVNFDCFGAEHSDGGSAYINVETTAWFCHGCKRRGNAISLVADVFQVERPTAERHLRDWYGIAFNEPAGGSMMAETDARFREEPEVSPPIRPGGSWLLGAAVDWPDQFCEWSETQGINVFSYMFRRGFSPEILTEWDIGYDYMSDRVTIPVFNVEGELVGVKGRDWTGERVPKYLILGDRVQHAYGFSPYEASEVVLGLHRERGHKTVVICEGELNALALAQMGVRRPVAIGMSYFSDRHAQLIIQEADEAIVYLDGDDAGRTGVWGRTDANGTYFPGIVAKLEMSMMVKIVDPPWADPAELLQLGKGQVALDAITAARTSLAIQTSFG